MKWLVASLIAFAGVSWADDENPYFHAIHCKAVWSDLSNEERARVPGTNAAIAAIEKVLQGYVASGAKTARAIDADIGDLKAYSDLQAHHVKAWRTCVDDYAPGSRDN